MGILNLKYSTVYSVYIFLIYLIGTNFFYLHNFGRSYVDIMTILSLIIIFTKFNKIYRYIKKEDFHIYLYYIYSFTTSLIMSFINFGQPLKYSFLASRTLLESIIIYISLEMLLEKYSMRMLYILSFLISIAYSALNLYIYSSGFLEILDVDKMFFYRLGEIRIHLASEVIVFFMFFFFYDLKNRHISYIPLILLLITLILVDKTRAIMFAMAVILMFEFFKINKVYIVKIWTALFLLLVSIFIFTDLSTIIFSPLLDLINATLSEANTGGGTMNVRAIALNYFLSQQDILSIIFGSGVENKSYKILYPSVLFLSDLGIFKIYYQYGLVGLFLFITIYYKMFLQAIKGNSAIHKTGQAIVLFQLFAPTICFGFYPRVMFLFYILYILLKKINMRNENG